jgi:hypothetical protein
VERLASRFIGRTGSGLVTRTFAFVGFAGVLLGVGLGATAPGSMRAPTPTGEGVVRQMHDRYVGRWYKTLTFKQTTTRHPATGHDTVETWYESVSVPGKLRIDFGAPSHGDGVLFRADSTYRFKAGAVTRAVAGGNELLALAFDVYAQPVEITVASLRAAGFNLDKVHADSWGGRAAWVVGAEKGDTASEQSWIDQERLVILRQLGAHVDARFNDYQRAGGGWIAPHVELRIDGVLRQQESYAEITADRPLNAALFDPAQWTTAPHWVPAGN